MAISVVVAVGAVADPLVDAIAARIPDVVVGPGDDPAVDDGTAHHRRAPRPGAVLRRGRHRRGRHGRGRRLRPIARTGDGFFVGCSLLDGVEPGHARLRRRDLRAGAERRARRHLRRRASRWSTPTRTATASRSSPATAARPGASSARCRSAWSASTCPIPVPVASHSFGGWKASLFGDSADLRPRGHPLLHPARRSSPPAGPTPPRA